jgi:VIT1/CCC1 family predicted Fe2+/Mn2+ transporter
MAIAEQLAAIRRQRPEHHRDVQGGSARAAVFGISDGLLTNVSLILGVAGANPAPGVVRLAGLAGLVAGAFSMGTGEYVSMRAQTELLQRELDIEREEIRRHPVSEWRELVGMYVKRGLRREVAEEVATVLMRDPAVALDTHSREELGVDPESLGSPMGAALSSFTTFSFGALVPLLPWFFTSSTRAVIASVLVGALMSVAIGVVIAQFTGRSRVRTATRQLLLATVAAAVTFGVGRGIGVQAS